MAEAELNKLEKKVLEYLKQGKSDEEIAEELDIAEKNVKIIITKLVGLGLYKKSEIKAIKRDVFGTIFYLETNVDKLFDLINTKKEISVQEASDILGVHVEKVQEWGEILESHGLINLHYPLFGKPTMRIKELVVRKKVIKEKKAVKKEIKEAKKLRKGRKGKKILVLVVFLFLISFVYYLLIDRLIYHKIAIYVIDIFNNIINLVITNQFYLYILIIIIILLIVLAALIRKRAKIKFWWFRVRLKH